MEDRYFREAIAALQSTIEERDSLMSTYDTETLSSILAAHKLWVQGKPGGVRADLSGADLSGAKR